MMKTLSKESEVMSDLYFIISDQNREYRENIKPWVTKELSKGTPMYITRDKRLVTSYGGISPSGIQMQFTNEKDTKLVPFDITTHESLCTLFDFLERAKQLTVIELNDMDFYFVKVVSPDIIQYKKDLTVIEHTLFQIIQKDARSAILDMYLANEELIQSRILEKVISFPDKVGQLGVYTYLTKFWGTRLL